MSKSMDATVPVSLGACLGERAGTVPRASAPSIDWQPIATVPRDGTPVDLWHKEGFRVTDEWWDSTPGDECWAGQLFPDTDFTHWKPITEPDSTCTTHEKR